MKTLARKFIFAAIGLILVLGYWTYFDKKPVSTGASHMPAKVFGGGGDSLVIDIDINGKAEVSIMADQPRQANGEQPIEEDYEKLDPGHHTFTVELPPKVMGTVDLRALEPQVGNKLSWTVTRAGKQIAHETDTLDKPLQAGYAQGLQVQLESEEASNDDSE